MSELSNPMVDPKRNRDPERPFVSVVVPVFNEEPCLLSLHQRLRTVLSTIDDWCEIVFVNDGSRDGSLELLHQIRDSDDQVAVYSFSRNFGHESATSCGMAKATGQTVVLIDADLQDPPELISEMVDRWHEGYDLVFAQRRRRAGESMLTKATSHLFYRVINRLAAVDLPVDTGDFRLMDRGVVDAFLQFPERNRFVRGLVTSTGFRQVAVLYDRDARLAGVTKYDFFKRLALAFDAICGMSTVPLRLLHSIGGLLLLFGMLTTTGCLAYGLVAGSPPGVPLLAGVIIAMGGVQLLSAGLLGEYLGRVFIEVKNRPLYIVQDELPARRNNEATSKANMNSSSKAA